MLAMKSQIKNEKIGPSYRQLCTRPGCEVTTFRNWLGVRYRITVYIVLVSTLGFAFIYIYIFFSFFLFCFFSFNGLLYGTLCELVIRNGRIHQLRPFIIISFSFFFIFMLSSSYTVLFLYFPKQAGCVFYPYCFFCIVLFLLYFFFHSLSPCLSVR